MSLPQETVLQLMAFADGELEGDDRASIEALVEQSDEARQVVEAIRSPALGSWLNEEMNARTAAADGIADAVIAALANAEPASGGSGGEVVRLAERGGRRGPRVQVVGGVLVAALAIAAGVALYVSSVGPGTDATKTPVASVGVPSVDVEPPSNGVAQRPSQGVEVDEVDSPARGFSVFEIPVGGSPAGAANAAGPSSVVIMIDDPPGAK
jgi:anti-sigma factor RsiW